MTKKTITIEVAEDAIKENWPEYRTVWPHGKEGA